MTVVYPVYFMKMSVGIQIYDCNTIVMTCNCYACYDNIVNH